MKTQAEAGAMWPRAEEQGLEEGRIPPWSFRGSSVLLAPRRGLRASRPVRGETAGVQAPQPVVICYGSPRTRSHPGGTLALLERDGGPRGL